MSKRYFEYTENNDWEGEEWTVGIRLEEGHKGVQVLTELIPFLEKYAEDEYTLKEIDVDRFNLLQSYSVDDDDDFGYYPPYMIDKYNDNFEVLLRELKEIKDIESVDVGLIYQLFDNNLYKLKVFK